MTKKISRRSLLRFTKRLLVSFLAVSGFFVLTQDFQVFPTLVSGVLGLDNGEPSSWVDRGTARTEDGESIDVWRVAAVGQRRAVTMLHHGNGDTLQGLSRFQKFLSENGITSYSYDYRGSGASTGWPSEQGLYRDASAVAKYVLEKEKISPRELSLVGFSIGTGPASHLAKEISPARLLLVSPYHDLRMVVREMPFFGLLSPFLRYDFPTGDVLPQLEETKVTLFHGEKDTTIPIHHSERIIERFEGKNLPEFLRLENVGHNDILSHVADMLVDKILGVPLL